MRIKAENQKNSVSLSNNEIHVSGIGSDTINNVVKATNNLAEYWANQAEGSAKKAKQSEENASISAKNASKSEINVNNALEEIQTIANGFDEHVVVKTNEFDEHTVTKQGEFDAHVTEKQNDFDVNALTLTARYDNNDLARTKAFNKNAEEKQALVDASAESARKYANGTIEEYPDGSAKYWAGKAEESASGKVIDDTIVATNKTYSSSKIEAELEKKKNKTITILKNPINDGYYLEGNENANTIYNYVYGDKTSVELAFDDIITNTGEQIYPFETFDKDRNAIFRRNIITKDKVERINIKVDYQGTVTFEPVQFDVNPSKGYLTGEVSTDKRMVDQLVDMRHSTFDKSKFTVVGTPTITDDGIASGFSGSNRVLSKYDVSLNSNFKICCKAFIPKNLPQDEHIISYPNYALQLKAFKDNRIEARIDLGSSKAVTFNNVIFDNEYYFEIEKRGNIFYLRYGLTKENMTEGAVEIPNEQVSSGALYIGTLWDNNIEYFTGSIDLKQFSISVDGKEVFSGNKTGLDGDIPYTLSSTGAKIVDVADRPKVQALYEREGKALYYTLDEVNKNCTLPMGELYGFIDDTKDNSLNKQMITNCITEIPQDIKVEVKDGYIVLKAGSKLYVPNGADKFDVIVTDKDYNTSAETYVGNDNTLIFADISGNSVAGIYSEINTKCFSGDNPPVVQLNFDTWYDTKNNLVKRTKDNGATWAGKYSLPICVSYRNNGKYDGIDQVFNGFGYIGSTVFALPNVKGLIPNGRNADGSLKSTEFITNKVTTITEPIVTGSQYLLLNGQLVTNFNTVIYDEAKNIQYNGGNPYIDKALVGYLERKSGKITSFNSKQPFRALDYSTPHIIDTYVNGTSGYNIYSNGFCIQWGDITKSGKVLFLKSYKDTNYSIVSTAGYSWNAVDNAITHVYTDGFDALKEHGNPFRWVTMGYIA